MWLLSTRNGLRSSVRVSFSKQDVDGAWVCRLDKEEQTGANSKSALYSTPTGTILRPCGRLAHSKDCVAAWRETILVM